VHGLITHNMVLVDTKCRK